MTGYGGSWSTQQLAEFLAAVTASHDEAAATRGAVEWAAEALEAEVGAFVLDAKTVTCVGFPSGEAPEEDLARVAGGEDVDLRIPGAVAAHTLVAPLDDGGHIVLARSGEGAFSIEEAGLLRAMARCLSMTLRTLRVLDVERNLRVISERQAAENLENVRLRAMHLSVTRTLAESPSGEEACTAVLRTVVQSRGWQRGEFWLVDPSSTRLDCQHVYPRPGTAVARAADEAEPAAVTAEPATPTPAPAAGAATTPAPAAITAEPATTTPAPAAGAAQGAADAGDQPGSAHATGAGSPLSPGLPARVLETGAAVFTRDVDAPSAAVPGGAAPRSARGRRPPRGGVGFPVVSGTRLVGVLAFYAPRMATPSSDLLSVMASIGSQIGQTMARRDAEDALRRSEENFRLLFVANPHPMWVWDEETLRFLAVNDAAVAKYGYSRSEFLGMTVAQIRAEEEAPAFLDHVSHNLHDGPAGVWRHRLKDGRVIDAEITVHRQPFEGRPGVLVLSQDVTERRALERQLEHQAFHDPLTGLANRALFNDRLEQAVARHRRGGGFAMLLLDLDDFKTVNDRLGHAAGDQLLVSVGTRLPRCARPGDSIARLGGDEFAILLEDVGHDESVLVAKRIIAALREPFTVHGSEVFTGASVGIALWDSGSAVGPEELVRCADVAMYSAKLGGKSAHMVFDAEMHVEASRRMEIRESLRHAAARGELEIHYQPVVRLEDGGLAGTEALVRWQHPVRGMLSPAEFITIAESTGAIVDIGRWVLAEAARQTREWSWRFPQQRLDVSVNVSLRELQEDDFVEHVLATLASTGLAPAQLVLEITESMLMRERDVAVAKLEALRAHGVRVAIDDFGTGYSSLTYLRHLPADIVKIDRSFVAGLATDAGDRSLTLAVVRLLGTLDVQTVVEGIERREQLDYVRAMGCDLGQGYLFSRPLTAEAMAGYIAARPDEKTRAG